jgi:hypothetical protein
VVPGGQHTDFRQVRDRPGQHLPPEPLLLHRAGVHVDQPRALHRGDLLDLHPHLLESLRRPLLPVVGVRLRVAHVHDPSRHLVRPAYIAVHPSSSVRARGWPNTLGAVVDLRL